MLGTLFLFIFLHNANSFLFTVKPRSDVYFYEEYDEKSQITGHMQVVKGGNMMVEFEIKSPNDQSEFFSRSSNEVFNITAKTSGLYRFGFSSKAAYGEKLVSLALDKFILESQFGGKGSSTFNETEKLVYNLVVDVDAMASEQERLQIRERARSELSRRTSRSLIIWSIVQFFVVVGVCLWHAKYFHDLFEKRSHSI
ncbi:putative p24 family protein beta-1 [Monocercomonoides exilis]|uniref:putative p24 family protein beta-1 n=1 Tax=Monocercomonoides exilis TaxID=2049356 RepID=UPI0035599F79|nr:putative p24 family protein beta-1 [Monocercomonoides exilis]|eukprot:MONOS_12436.1-p1 / transcript=MONOS_12436.1 / gene=MONOS_12436 / organism=Monocercomonoides_exilis_PA203 / gene_product=unspecified product / transcript_product=unspecified product / location=Mono_scaffold00689:15541-16428(-) / protein_length=196 / sequence_SO=supercontig / SO=protein_coding / is_pseudo=false